MRRPRDLDAELKALDERARQLRMRKVMQAGELVIACKADVLPVEMLAGALLEAAGTKDTARMEAWQARGAAFFRGAQRARNTGAAAGNDPAPRTSPAGVASSADAGAEPPR